MHVSGHALHLSIHSNMIEMCEGQDMQLISYINEKIATA